MTRSRLCFVLTACLSGFAGRPLLAASRPSGSQAASAARLSETLLEAPMLFEPNQGQADSRARFVASGPVYAVLLTASGAEISLRAPAGRDARAEVIGLKLVGSSRRAAILGEEPRPARSNYLRGSDPARWLTNVVTYGSVRYREVYPGIDLIYHGNTQQQLEYDFVVAPGADPESIALHIEGVRKLGLDRAGNLSLKTASGVLLEHAPVIYQEVGGRRVEIAGRYVLKGKREVGFKLAAYDRKRRSPSRAGPHHP